MFAKSITDVVEQGRQVNIIRINFNLLEFEELTDYRALHRYVEESYCEGLDNIVMIDEVQTCVGFEKAVNSLHASGKYDIYVTGSNAFLLSSDLASSRTASSTLRRSSLFLGTPAMNTR